MLPISFGHFSAWYFDQLRARHPGDPWPVYHEEDAQAAFPALLDALGRVRPITFAMDPRPYLRFGPAEWWGARTFIPRGLLLEVLLREPAPDRAGLARFNGEFWRNDAAHPVPVRRQADLETDLIHLHYADAMLRCADFLVRQGATEAAGEIYQRTLTLDTDRIEEEAERAFRGIGRTRPRLEVAARARQALAAPGSAGSPAGDDAGR